MTQSKGIDRRTFHKSAAAAAALSAIFAASKSHAADAALSGERLVVADFSEPTTLDPTTSRTFSNRNNYDHLFIPICHRRPDNSTAPGAAEKWDYVTETQVRFKLRQDLKFHNGEAIDAVSVKYSLDRYRDPKISEAGSRLATIAKVEIVDPYTVDVHTKQPDPVLLANFADGLFPVPPKAHAEMGAQKFARAPIGSGPWKFVRWDAGDKVVATRDDNYYRGPAKFKDLVLRFIADDNTRVAALLAGDVDLIRGIPAADVARIKNSGKANVVSGPATRLNFLGINWPLHKSLSDVRVRLALNYAIDMDALINVVLRGYGIPMSQQCFDGCFGYNPDVKPFAYDPKKAQALLREAGYGPGQLKLTLDYPIGNIPNSGDIAQAVAAMYQAVGIDLKLNPEEWGSYWARVNSKPENLAELYMMYSNAPGADSSEVTLPYFSPGVAWNWSRYDNKEIQALILKAGSSVDSKMREPIYKDVAKRLHDEAVYVYLNQWINLYGVKKGLTLTPRPDSQFMVYDYLTIDRA